MVVFKQKIIKIFLKYLILWRKYNFNKEFSETYSKITGKKTKIIMSKKNKLDPVKSLADNKALNN